MYGFGIAQLLRYPDSADLLAAGDPGPEISKFLLHGMLVFDRGDTL